MWLIDPLKVVLGFNTIESKSNEPNEYNFIYICVV